MSNVENIGDHMALTCHCGSVKFCLLRSGIIECAACQDRPGVAWHQHDDPAQIVGDVVEIIDGDNEGGPYACVALHNPVEIGVLLMRTVSKNENEATIQCKVCFGKGWNDVWRKVTGHHDGGELFREECESCKGLGRRRVDSFTSEKT